ncbi:hypothetical protein MKZ38_006372 [Zalerion maritima]|uniref:Fucosyltransferase n=1 Tax=Zalerion maritima TaxID=339359 RepID=A0AAD5RVJ2_9PEZI|nr:hypothetical protein MKZ38_006372 [Zalerion maritima]
MTSHLEVPRSTTKMVVSPPTINLRKAASYHEKGPLSSTSSVFSFNHLVFNSPPPSPSLPALVPRRPRRLSGPPRPTRVFRTLLWISGILLLFYCTSHAVSRDRKMPWDKWYIQKPDIEYEMVAQEDFPDFPTPIAITDKAGSTKWTFWVPPTYDFPQDVKEYSDVAAKCHEVATHVRDVVQEKPSARHTIFGDKHVDPTYVDVKEALEVGMLPSWQPSHGKSIIMGWSGGLVGLDWAKVRSRPVCKKSMTFVMESANPGIGNAMMLMWMAYGVAQSQGRSFFIDDSRWAYGEYTDVFKKPPVPDCQPPPRNEMIPCPHHARHLVVTSATAKEILEMAFTRDFEDPLKMELYRQKQMFNYARKGYEALFKLNDDDSKYVEKRIEEFDKKTAASETGASDGVIVGVHVRRGDCHPLEYQYQDSYIPLNYYKDQVNYVLENKLNSTVWTGIPSRDTRDHSYVVLASDDPTVYDSDEFKGALRAQAYINLASKSAIEHAKQKDKHKKPWTEEDFGWEGGFFASMFWNLGLQSMNAKGSNAPDAQEVMAVAPGTMQMRSYLGRAYMMDLAVLAERSDTVVCAVSAMGCRLLAVMMGWTSAIEKGTWVNIDGGFGWTGLTW